MKLTELLNARAGKIKAQRDLLDKAKTEERELSEEEVSAFDKLDTEIEELDGKIENVKKEMEREQKVANREKDLDKPALEPFRPADMSTQPKQLDNGGFKNLGEFISSLRFGDAKGRIDALPLGQGEGGGRQVPEAFRSQLMPGVYNEQSMGTGTEGGFAVPPQFMPNLMQLNPEAAIVRPLAAVMPAGTPPDAPLTMPALDQGTNGVFGGVTVGWIGEGDTKPDTSAKFKEVTLSPYEVAATMTVTDKLLRNWDAATPVLNTLLTNAMSNAEDMAFLTGDGTGKPTGILTATGAKAVHRSAANTITTADIIAMFAQLYSESRNTAVWVASQSTMPQIVALKDDNNNNIFLRGDITKGIPDTLLGLPIKFTGKTSVLGAKGDLMLADFSNYLIKDGSGPFIAASEHVLFTQNKTVIKVFWNVDGKPWVTAPLTLDDGATTVSPYVVLDIPAA